MHNNCRYFYEFFILPCTIQWKKFVHFSDKKIVHVQRACRPAWLCWLTLVYLLYVYTLVLHTSYQNVSYYVVVPYRNRTADWCWSTENEIMSASWVLQWVLLIRLTLCQYDKKEITVVAAAVVQVKSQWLCRFTLTFFIV